MQILSIISKACLAFALTSPNVSLAQQTVDISALMGNWQCESHNDASSYKSQKTFSPSGQVTTNISVQDQMDDSNMGVVGNGTWKIEGSVLVEQPKEYDFYELSFNGASLLGDDLEKAMISEMLYYTSRSEIKELSDNRLVISPLGDSTKMVCLRREA